MDPIEELERRIRTEINSISQGILKQVWDNIKLRLNFIKQVNRGTYRRNFGLIKSPRVTAWLSPNLF